MPRKREIERPYAPDFVSAETLACRLVYSPLSFSREPLVELFEVS